jgi:hypothetical protein
MDRGGHAEAMPQASRLQVIRKATCSHGALTAAPTINGTATALAYLTSMC